MGPNGRIGAQLAGIERKRARNALDPPRAARNFSAPMRFLHLADVHLDTPFAGRSDDVRRRLREASREALRRAVSCAIAERVHAVLLAGDLFDGERLSFGTERFLAGRAGPARRRPASRSSTRPATTTPAGTRSAPARSRGRRTSS